MTKTHLKKKTSKSDINFHYFQGLGSHSKNLGILAGCFRAADYFFFEGTLNWPNVKYSEGGPTPSQWVYIATWERAH